MAKRIWKPTRRAYYNRILEAKIILDVRTLDRKAPMDPLTLCMSAVADGSGSFISAVIDTITTTVDPHVSTITMPGVLEYAAVVSGALSGAMIACERKLDILGVVVLAIVTGLGGGLLRDMILPTDSVYMIDNPMTMVVAALAATLVFFFRSAIGRFKALIFIFDILSVALFTFSGADKALRLDMDYGFLSCVLMGVITAVGGGMLRDICLGEVPSIFRAGNFYAIASLAGAVVYMGLVDVHVIKPIAAVLCVVVTMALRIVSVRYNLRTTVPVDLTPKVTKPLKKAWRVIRRDSQEGAVVREIRIDGSGVNVTTLPTKPGVPLQQRDTQEDEPEPDADASRQARGQGTETK